MKSLLVCSLALLSTVALAKEPPVDLSLKSSSVKLVSVCAQLSVVAEDIIRGRSEVTEEDSAPLAFLLSNSFPQSYNAIYAGLISAHESSKLQITEHAPEQATVLGLWCVQDTVNEITEPSSPYLLEQETQVELVDIFEEVLTRDIP